LKGQNVSPLSGGANDQPLGCAIIIESKMQMDGGTGYTAMVSLETGEAEHLSGSFRAYSPDYRRYKP
jgi:hypothetical protein